IVELLLASAEISRSPVHLAQAVEDRPADADPGVLAEGHFVRGAEAPGGVHESNASRLNQVVKLHEAGQPAQNVARNLLHLRQVVEDKVVEDKLLLLLLATFSCFGGQRLRIWLRREGKQDCFGEDRSAGHRLFPPSRRSWLGRV